MILSVKVTDKIVMYYFSCSGTEFGYNIETKETL